MTKTKKQQVSIPVEDLRTPEQRDWDTQSRLEVLYQEQLKERPTKYSWGIEYREDECEPDKNGVYTVAFRITISLLGTGEHSWVRTCSGQSYRQALARCYFTIGREFAMLNIPLLLGEFLVKIDDRLVWYAEPWLSKNAITLAHIQDIEVFEEL